VLPLLNHFLSQLMSGRWSAILFYQIQIRRPGLSIAPLSEHPARFTIPPIFLAVAAHFPAICYLDNLGVWMYFPAGVAFK
jgi:hypothetical protein